MTTFIGNAAASALVAGLVIMAIRTVKKSLHGGGCSCGCCSGGACQGCGTGKPLK